MVDISPNIKKVDNVINWVYKLSKTFKLDFLATQAFVDYYNYHYEKYDNNIYKHLESRIAHWHNYYNGGWFQRRIDIFLDILEQETEANSNVILVDLGFSVPYPYSRNNLVNKENIKCVFIDKYQSSDMFLEGVSSELGCFNRTHDDKVIIQDIESTEGRNEILKFLSKIKTNNKTRIVVMASEIIEHLNDPAGCFNFIEQICKMPNCIGSAYVTLPIGLKIPSHTIEFISEKETRSFVNKFSNIKYENVLEPLSGIDISPYLKKCYCAYVDFS